MLGSAHWKEPSSIPYSKYNFDIQRYDWNTGLFACCLDPKTLCEVFCFPLFMAIDVDGWTDKDDILVPSCRCCAKEREEDDDKECYEVCSDCCEKCMLPSMMCCLMFCYGPIVSPCMSGCLRKDFIERRFETDAAREYHGGKKKYFQMTNCMIGTCCPLLSNAQIMREFIVRGYHDQRKKLQCGGRGMYDDDEEKEVARAATDSVRKGYDGYHRDSIRKDHGAEEAELKRLEEESKKRRERAEELRRQAEEMERESEEQERRLEEARHRREELERFQGNFTAGSSDSAVFEMKADRPFGTRK